MKRCPQCRAEYDDHVEYCFVDGAELVPHTGMLQLTTPLPPPPAPTRSLLPMLLVLGVMGMVVLASGLVLIVFLLMEPQIATVEPEPAPEVKLPAGEQAEPEDTVLEVRLSSSPSGAEVWEFDKKLCAQTPCTIEHPAGEVLERELIFKLDGYTPRKVTMDDPTRSWDTTLTRIRSRPRPVPAPVRPPAVPTPMIEDER